MSLFHDIPARSIRDCLIAGRSGCRIICEPKERFGRGESPHAHEEALSRRRAGAIDRRDTGGGRNALHPRSEARRIALQRLCGHKGRLSGNLTWGALGQERIYSGMCQTPRAVSVSEVRARLHDAARFRARSTSHGELWVKSGFIRACVKLQGLFRYPRSEPDCMTRPVSEHDQPHIRLPLETAVPTSRLRRAGAQGMKPFYQSACRAMVTIGSSTRIRQN